MNFKEKFTKCKEWIKEHKGIVIGAGVTAILGCIGVAISRQPKKVDQLSEKETDYGRDCTMRFIVDETQEVLGEIPCTELYAKENIESYEECVK